MTDNKKDANDLLLILKAAVKAGRMIMEVYDSDFSVEQKSDDSPLTLADKKAHEAITYALAESEIPLLSEEGRDIPYEERKTWQSFWMVDPLDGTKEFIKRNGEFTVNIARIDDGKPTIGVILAPVKGLLYFGTPGHGAYRKMETLEQLEQCSNLNDFYSNSKKLPISNSSNEFNVVGSRSHMSEETVAFIEGLKIKHGNVGFKAIGSSLKLCLVAEGSAHVYPRFAPTMEWDTAAGHAIAVAAGKQVLNKHTGNPMKYNKENLLNDWFIVE